MSEARKINALVGIPWSEVTCWGLVCRAYRELFGIELPGWEHIDPMNSAAIAKAIARGRKDWRPVTPARFGDVLLFSVDCDLPTHCAMAIDDRRMLHIRKHQLSQIDWYDDSDRGRLWRPRLRGIYRYEA